MTTIVLSPLLPLVDLKPPAPLWPPRIPSMPIWHEITGSTSYLVRCPYDGALVHGETLTTGQSWDNPYGFPEYVAYCMFCGLEWDL